MAPSSKVLTVSASMGEFEIVDLLGYDLAGSKAARYNDISLTQSKPCS